MKLIFNEYGWIKWMEAWMNRGYKVEVEDNAA